MASWRDLWPYATFVAAVIVYNYFLLGDGFCSPLDEGFLQSVAQRLLYGERPYHDFHWWRTPLTLYLQAALMWIFDDRYTIMAARIFCVVQTAGIAVLLSVIYRRLVRPWELLLLLLTSFTLISMLLTFPWYNYDALMFSAIALVLLSRRRFVMSGAAVALAGLAKQNYLLLLPLVLGVAATLFVFRRDSIALKKRDAMGLIGGWMFVNAVFVCVLLIQGDLKACFSNVFLYPRQAVDVPLTFALFQDSGLGLQQALPYLLLLAVLAFAPRRRWVLLTLGAAVAWFYGMRLVTETNTFIYACIFTNYLAVIVLSRKSLVLRGSEEGEGFAMLPACLIFILVIQYLSGFNLGGLQFAVSGAGIALPIVYLALRNSVTIPKSAIFATSLLLVIFAIGAYHKYRFVYHEGARSTLSASYTAAKLAGVSSSPKLVTHVEGLLKAVEEYSRPGDYIFTYPDYPSLYFLTGRRNPTTIDWYWKVDAVAASVDSSFARLEIHRPKVVLVNRDSIPDNLSSILSEKYREVRRIDEVHVYIPTAASE